MGKTKQKTKQMTKQNPPQTLQETMIPPIPSDPMFSPMEILDKIIPPVEYPPIEEIPEMDQPPEVVPPQEKSFSEESQIKSAINVVPEEKSLEDILRESEGITEEEGKAVSEHIHMLLTVPPKYSIAMVIGYLKGKSAVRIHREILKAPGTLFGRTFWARGYCVSTVGLDEHEIRQYVRDQEKLQKEQNQAEIDLA